jgi:hypothetical protein
MATNAGTFLDINGLGYYDSQLKAVVGGGLTISGRTISLKAVAGAVLATVTVPETVYTLATSLKDGLISASDFTKIQGISEGANKVTASSDNGYILIDGVSTKVYTPPSVSALTSGMYKITVNANGYVTAGEAVKKSDITALGIPAQDTTYTNATSSKAGLMSSSDYTKLQGVAEGAQVNVIETVKVNGTALTVNSKIVNIDLSAYALKTDISAAVNYRGSVDNYSDLPTSPTIGDMYNVANADASHDVDAGDNVVWTGSAWDVLSGMIVIDAVTNAQIDELFE